MSKIHDTEYVRTLLKELTTYLTPGLLKSDWEKIFRIAAGDSIYSTLDCQGASRPVARRLALALLKDYGQEGRAALIRWLEDLEEDHPGQDEQAPVLISKIEAFDSEALKCQCDHAPSSEEQTSAQDISESKERAVAHSIPPRVRVRLINEWLPQLRRLREERKPHVRLVTIILMCPLSLAMGLIVVALWTDSPVIPLVGAYVNLGIAAFVSKWLGKLYDCNDAIIAIELAIHLGERDHLIETISRIECFSAFEGVLDHAKNIIAG